MAFFKFRKGGDEPSGAPAQPESIEAMRKRAKYRLIGAAVLVLIGVVGFPILFDKQPRPISVDIPIEIPDRAKAKPLTIPEPVAIPAVQAIASAPVPPPAPVTPPPAAPKAEEKVTPAAAPVASAAPKVAAKVESKAVEKAPEKPAPAVARSDDGSQAKALLEGKDIEKRVDAHAGRFVIQVGAFSDAERAREARLKVEHAGLKTYTQVAETKDGRKTRVRVGPFATKAEAEKAAAKIKKLGLPTAMLTL
jgi:DedD protein